MEKLYIVTKNKTGSWLIAKFRLKLKKVEKTTRPFRYDLNQIPYDYIYLLHSSNSLLVDSFKDKIMPLHLA